MWTDLKPLNLSKIQKYPFPENKYFKEEHKKTQVLLHHTVSGPNIKGDVDTWINNQYNVGTCIIVDREGIPWQLFSSKYWAYHIGAGDHNQDRRSIGIELDNWGGLKLGNGNLKMFRPRHRYFRRFKMKPTLTTSAKYYTIYGNSVDVPVQYYPEGFRGFNYFEKYTEAQLRTVGELLLFWRDRYKIPLNYYGTSWDVNADAKSGKPGVWTHVSFRPDKSDCHPQPELIEMLKTIQAL